MGRPRGPGGSLSAVSLCFLNPHWNKQVPSIVTETASNIIGKSMSSLSWSPLQNQDHGPQMVLDDILSVFVAIMKGCWREDKTEMNSAWTVSGPASRPLEN